MLVSVQTLSSTTFKTSNYLEVVLFAYFREDPFSVPLTNQKLRELCPRAKRDEAKDTGLTLLPKA